MIQYGSVGRLAAIALLTAGLAGPVAAQAPAAPAPLLVAKKTFEMPSYHTRNGAELRNVKVGWESYGQLNAAKDNAILVAHFFSGNSHVAGRYAASDPAPGYWDSIVGPGKAIDTDKYFVLSVDSLVNLNTGDPNTVTTGPATINPATGKPYGSSFPVVSIRDFVEVQKALVESLGIKKLHAVAGASMGSFQVLEWAVSHPEMVARALPVIGAPQTDGWVKAWLHAWTFPILTDPNWKGGDYYGGPAPEAGLTHALAMVTLHARSPEWVDRIAGTKIAAGQQPATNLKDTYQINNVILTAARARAKVADAAHFVYLVRANELFLNEYPDLDAAYSRVKAKVLVLSASTDRLFPPAQGQMLRDILRKHGADATYAEIAGDGGHIDGVTPPVAGSAALIKAFIDK